MLSQPRPCQLYLYSNFTLIFFNFIIQHYTQFTRRPRKFKNSDFNNILHVRERKKEGGGLIDKFKNCQLQSKNDFEG